MYIYVYLFYTIAISTNKNALQDIIYNTLCCILYHTYVYVHPKIFGEKTTKINDNANWIMNDKNLVA